jgi:hypothetical protein
MSLIPATVADMKPLKHSTLIAELASFERAHYEEVKPLLECLAGEKPSKHGSFALDEADLVFSIKRIAEADGYGSLDSVATVKVLRAFRHAHKRNTGTTFRALAAQRKLLIAQVEQPI